MRSILLAVAMIAVSGCGRSGDTERQPVGDTANTAVPGSATPKGTPPRLADLSEDEALARIAELGMSGDAAGLSELLRHQSRNVAESAAKALAAIGKAAVPVLAKLLGSPDAQVRSLSLRALAEIGPGALAAAVPGFVKRRLESTSPEEPWRTLQELAEIGPDALTAAVPVFVRLLQSAKPDERALAVQALGDIGSDAAAAAPALTALVKGEDRALGHEAAEALAWIDPRTHDPGYPSKKLEPWIGFAVQKKLPMPDTLVREKKTAAGKVVVLDSRRRDSYRQLTRHQYLIGLSGPGGPEALVFGETTEDIREEPDAEVKLHKIGGAPVAVELLVSCQDHPHYTFALGVLVALPSLERLAEFTAVNSTSSPDRSSAETSYVKIRKNEQGGTADVLLVTNMESSTGDTPAERSSIEKLLRQIPLPTSVTTAPSTSP